MNEELILKAWQDDAVYDRFVKAMKKKGIRLDSIQWDGKDSGAPHSTFKKWLIGEKI